MPHYYEGECTDCKFTAHYEYDYPLPPGVVIVLCPGCNTGTLLKEAETPTIIVIDEQEIPGD